MSKTTFDLEEAHFSSSDDEGYDGKISEQMIQRYNREYSLVFQEIHEFLKKCKESIFKYISLNQFGVGFNIANMFTSFSKMETSLLDRVSDVEKQQLENRRHLKQQYQTRFEDIVSEMAGVIEKFLEFEIRFKQNYFGCTTCEPLESHQSSMRRCKSPTISFKPSMKNPKSSFGSSIHSEDSINKQQKNSKEDAELENKLRNILKQKLTPSRSNLIKFCHQEQTVSKNLTNLEQKIDMMQSELILNRTHEEKIIEIFNKNRVENIHKKSEETPEIYNQSQSKSTKMTLQSFKEKICSPRNFKQPSKAATQEQKGRFTCKSPLTIKGPEESARKLGFFQKARNSPGHKVPRQGKNFKKKSCQKKSIIDSPMRSENKDNCTTDSSSVAKGSIKGIKQNIIKEKNSVNPTSIHTNRNNFTRKKATNGSSYGDSK